MSVQRGKGLRRSNPQHPHTAKYLGIDVRVLKCFIWMQDRVCLRRRRARVCDFPRTREGALAFVAEMGPIPEGMLRPSVGRIDHDKGYVKGNIRWESHHFNSWRGRRPEPTPVEDDMPGRYPNEEDIPF